MTQFAIDDEDGGELDQSEVVVRLLLPADEQAAEAVELGMGDLDDPAPGRMTGGVTGRGQGLGGAGFGRGVRDIAMRTGGVPTGVIGVAAIQAQRGALRIRGVLGHGRDLDHEGIKLRHVGPIGPGHDAGHRHARAIGPQMAFRAACAPVGGIAARGFSFSRPLFLPSGAFTKQPSADCQWRSSPTNASYSSKRRGQARAKAPVSIHSLKRSCTVDFGPNSRGTAPHWAPVRSTQSTPSNRGRSCVRGQPGFLWGLTTTNRGARRAIARHPHAKSSGRLWEQQGS